MRTRIKFCGITTLEDAQFAARLGVDALGFVFSKSPRQVCPEAVRDIVSKLPPMITTIGVFVDEDDAYIRQVSQHCKLHTVQLSAKQGRRICGRIDLPMIYVYRMSSDQADIPLDTDIQACAYLFDSYDPQLEGGTGKSFDWHILANQKSIKPIVLAGGLNASNVARAISVVHPYAVDVSSGIEKQPGIKDWDAMRAFVEAVKDAGISQSIKR